jgi:hypothetical protein
VGQTAFIILCFCSNPIPHNRLLFLQLQSPWNQLHKLQTQNPAESGAECKKIENLDWWTLLEKVRTQFEGSTSSNGIKND